MRTRDIFGQFVTLVFEPFSKKKKKEMFIKVYLLEGMFPSF